MNKRTSSSFSWISPSLSSLETRGKSTSLSSWYFSSKLGGLITSVYQPNIQSVARASVELDPPTCISCPFVSFCGCARPCSFHNASHVSHPSGPACMSSPACSSATGSQSDVDPPLTHATSTSTHEFLNRVWIYSQKVVISAALPSTTPQG